jgi:hypothetical protein
MAAHKSGQAEEATAAGIAPTAAANPSAGVGNQRPPLATDIQQFFIPTRGSAPEGCVLLYRPMVIGAAKVSFIDTKASVDESLEICRVTMISDEAVPVSWDNARPANVAVSDLEKDPTGEAQYEDVPSVAVKAKSYTGWSRSFVTWLYGNQKLELLKSPGTGEWSKPGESERDFRVRLQQAARENRDAQVERLRQKYAPKIAALQDRIRRAGMAVERESAQANQSKLQTAISFGTTLLGAFLGRKAVSVSTLGRATTAARGVSRSMKEQNDIARAQESVEALQEDLATLEAQLQSETHALESKLDAQNEQLETIAIKPKKTNISVLLLALAWAPFWRDEAGEVQEAWE